MASINNNFIKNYIIRLTGEYATAIKLKDVLNLSLSYIYILTKNNKIRSYKKNGRTLYNVEDFINTLELAENKNIIINPLTKEDFYANNYCNWEAKNDIENFILNFLLDQLGEFTTVKDLVEVLKVSKTIWYEAVDEEKIIFFKIFSRIVIMTRSLLPFLREGLQAKI